MPALHGVLPVAGAGAVERGSDRAAATFKGLSEAAFIQQFTRLSEDRHGLALKDQPDGSCVFLEGNECAVQPVKSQ